MYGHVTPCTRCFLTLSFSMVIIHARRENTNYEYIGGGRWCINIFYKYTRSISIYRWRFFCLLRFWQATLLGASRRVGINGEIRDNYICEIDCKLISQRCPNANYSSSLLLNSLIIVYNIYIIKVYL